MVNRLSSTSLMRVFLIAVFACTGFLAACEQEVAGPRIDVDPIYDFHAADCGRALTDTVPPSKPIHLNVRGLTDNDIGRLEGRNDLDPSFDPLTDFSNPSTFVIDEPVPGIYWVQATVVLNGQPDQVLEPVRYIIPLYVALKVEKLDGQQVRLRAVPTGIEAPWTYQYSFCARPANSTDSSTETWRSSAPEDNWTVPMTVGGPWVFYVLVNAFQEGYPDRPAAIGEQIVFSDVDSCLPGTGCQPKILFSN